LAIDKGFPEMATRRALLGALVAGLVAPRLAFSQPARTASVVVLFAGESEDDEPATRSFFDEMRRLGWVEGTNITYERLEGRGEREYVEGLARSAASRIPDLIYATSTSTALAVVKETASIPVVFTSASNPVATGLVASLVRHGGNATGAFQSLQDAEQMRFELIREVYPDLKRFGLLLDRRSPDSSQETVYQAAARRVGLDLTTVKFTNFEAVAKIFGNLKRAGIVAVGFTPSYTLIARRREVVEAALRNRLALIGHRSEWAEVGALMTYGAEVADAQRRSARIADRILKGAKPAAIPVERATKTELVVNQRTAKTLGITIPDSVLRRADRVIE
jgi:putative ABC transport system substrate-binding protein